MSRRYIKVFFDWPDATAALTTEEKGQLIDAMIAYASGKPYKLSGNIAILFPTFKGQIDRDIEAYQKQVDGGRRGGNKKNHKDANPTLGRVPLLYQDKDKDNDNDYDYDEEAYTPGASSPSSYESGTERPGFDTIQVYASNCLRALTPGNMEALNAYVEEMGEELVRYALDAACAQGVASWRYAEKILIRLREQGIRTVGDAKAADEDFRRHRNLTADNLDAGRDDWT